MKTVRLARDERGWLRLAGYEQQRSPARLGLNPPVFASGISVDGLEDLRKLFVTESAL